MNLLNFYRGINADSEGRRFEDILASTDAYWDSSHTFIQEIFPTKRASNFNPEAPLLTKEDIAIWRADPLLKENLLRSYQRWLKFMGLEEQDKKVQFSPDILPYQEAFWSNFNHNFLRITRVLDSMVTLGLEDDARIFYQFLEKRFKSGGVSENTFKYWTLAVNGEIKA